MFILAGANMTTMGQLYASSQSITATQLADKISIGLQGELGFVARCHFAIHLHHFLPATMREHLNLAFFGNGSGWKEVINPVFLKYFDPLCFAEGVIDSSDDEKRTSLLRFLDTELPTLRVQDAELIESLIQATKPTRHQAIKPRPLRARHHLAAKSPPTVAPRTSSQLTQPIIFSDIFIPNNGGIKPLIKILTEQLDDWSASALLTDPESLRQVACYLSHYSLNPSSTTTLSLTMRINLLECARTCLYIWHDIIFRQNADDPDLVSSARTIKIWQDIAQHWDDEIAELVAGHTPPTDTIESELEGLINTMNERLQLIAPELFAKATEEPDNSIIGRFIRRVLGQER